MLKKFRELAYRNALVSSILIVVLFYFLMLGAARVFSLLPRSIYTDFAHEIFGMLYSVGIVLLFGFTGAFKTKNFFKGLLCGIVLIVMQSIALANFFVGAVTNPATVWASWSAILLGIVEMIGVGIREECFFRATVQNILLKKYAHSVKGLWLAAIVSAVLFGLFHLINLLVGGNPLAVLIQVVTNTGIGLFFAAVYLRGGNIWALVFIHALTDTAGLAASTFLVADKVSVINDLPVASLLGGALFAVIAVFLLRPSKCREILARYAEGRDHAVSLHAEDMLA